MIESFLALVVVFLLLNLVAGLWRVARGPTAADRMLAGLLFGSTTVAVLLVMAQWMAESALRTVGLVFVVLATIVTLAFFGTPEDGGSP
jgi:multicomponent Na+:H+ antiporter subunit F